MAEELFKSDLSLFFRFQNAVESLTVDEGDARSRLEEACSSIFPIQARDLPEKFRARWTEWIKSITRFSSGGDLFLEDENQGNLSITLKRIKNKTAAKMAQLIFDIFVYLVHNKNK